MDLDLTDLEARVIGSLVEKALTTPDQYPLSTNGLVGACNQKTSRDPVMALSATDVDAAMLSLRERGMARSLRPTGSRAWKHRHVLDEALDLGDSQTPVIAVLLLRGPQTPGELRTRTDRMHPFDDVDAVERVLVGLAERAVPLVRNLGRGPGQSQDRWVQLLTEVVPEAGPETPRHVEFAHESSAVSAPRQVDEVAELRSEVAELRERFGRLVEELGVDL